MLTIALGIILALFLLALLPAILEGIGKLLGIFIAAAILIYVGNILVSGTQSAKTIVLGIILFILFCFLLGILISLLNKFHSYKFILKFLTIKLLSPAFTDKQKVNQIKRLSELNKQIVKKKEQSKEKAKIDKYRKAQKNYRKLKVHLEKKLKYYLENDYISLNLFPPSVEANEGRIIIDSKVNKSIIELANNHNDWEKYGKDIFKVEKNSSFSQSYNNYFYGSSKFVAKKAKKFLNEYFKFHSEELN